MKRAVVIIVAILAAAACLAVFLIWESASDSGGQGPDAHVVFAERSVPADQAPQMNHHELVLGIVVNGQAKAYPAGMLHSTELVHDECGELPICATW